MIIHSSNKYCLVDKWNWLPSTEFIDMRRVPFSVVFVFLVGPRTSYSRVSSEGVELWPIFELLVLGMLFLVNGDTYLF